MRLCIIALVWLLSGFETAVLAEEPEPIVQELLAAREECAGVLLGLGLIGERASRARTDRIERCVTDRLGYNRHVLALVSYREARNPGTQVLFIDAVEEIRERMERIPHPYE